MSVSGAHLMPRNRMRQWGILLVIGIGSFTASLSTSTVNVALPRLQTAFSTNIATVTWVVTIFSLIVSGALLGFGRLGDLRGQRTLYITGCVIFAVSSGLCGASLNIVMLIGFRALEAIGAAMILANETGILTTSFPANRRGQVLGLQATMTYVGLAAGPALGGLLITYFGWRSVFLINLPLGLAQLALALVFIPADVFRRLGEPFDMAGTLIFIAVLAALLLGLNQGYVWGWLSPGILSLFGTALALIAVFLIIESRSPHPMLDLKLFHHSAFTSATLASLLSNVCVSVVLFVIPFVLIQGLNQSPALVGFLLAIRSLVMAGVAPFSGVLSDHIGAKPLRVAGLVILSMGALLLASNMGSTVPGVAVALAIMGLGNGVFIPSNSSALMGAAPPGRQGIAGGVLAAARNTGMALGVGLAGAVFATLVKPEQVTLAGASLRQAAQLSLVVATLAATIGALVVLIWESLGSKWVWQDKS